MKYIRQKPFSPGNRWLCVIVITLSCVLEFSGVSNAQGISGIITLEETYRFAMKSHERIAIAGEEIEKSRLLPKKAMSIILPHVSFAGSYIRMDDEITHTTNTHVTTGPYIDHDITIGPTPTVPEEQWIGNLKVTQSIYEASFFPKRKAAFHTIDRSTEHYHETIQRILFDVANVYYQIVKIKEVLQNAREILKLTERGLRVSRVKFQAGRVREQAVLQSELSVTRAERQVMQAKNNLKFAKDTLAKHMGIGMVEFDVAKPLELPVRTENYEALLDTAYEHRHDYEIAKVNVKLAGDDVKLAKTKFHPTLNCEWNYFWVDEETYALDNQFWNAIVKVDVPIFEGSLRFWDVKEKLTTRRQAKLALDHLKKSIPIEVEDAKLAVVAYEMTLRNLRKQVELAQKSYEIIFAQFQFGSATSLDLNQALTALSTVKTELITNTYDYQLALLNLERSIGLFATGYVTEARRNN